MSDSGTGPEEMAEEVESAVKSLEGYETLEAFIANFGEVDEFHNINQAILAFLGEDQ